MAKVVHTNTIDQEKIKKALQEEGFTNVFIWRDTKGTRYPLHTHPHYEVRWIVDGTLVIIEGSEEIELHPGDRLETLPDTPHEAFAKTDVTYICGSR